MTREAVGRDLLLVPSTNADPRTLASIAGVESWPERHLIELRHLLQPGNRVVLVTALPINNACLEVVLRLIQPVPSACLRHRLTQLCLHNPAPRSLSETLLARPDLLRQLQEHLRPGATLAAYAVGPAEMGLAQRLGLTLEGSPALLAPLGSKAGAAAVFAGLGFPHPATTACCHSLEQLAQACEELLLSQPRITALLVKLNCMAGGRGNAPLPLALEPWRQAPPAQRRDQLQRALEQLAMPLGHWREVLERTGAIGQERIEASPGRGQRLSSPSVQLWIDAAGSPRVISTHEQQLAGPHHQSFSGCRFPARAAYRGRLMAMADRLGNHLARLGCRGPVLLDLLARRDAQGSRLWAIEINLRKGGTSHPFLLAATGCDAQLEPHSGLLRSVTGAAIHYDASDGLELPRWCGRQPEQLLDALVWSGLSFNPARLQGCIPHRLGALQRHGLLGVTAVGRSRRQAATLLRQLQQLQPPA